MQPVRTWWRVWAPLLAVVAAAVAGPTVSAQGGGGPPGANLQCTPGSPQVIAQFTNPKQISGTGNLSCPPPGGTPGGPPFGPTGASPTHTEPPTPGTPCHFEYDSANQFAFGAGYLWRDSSPSGRGDAPGWTLNAFQDLGFMVSRGRSAEQLYMDAGTSDFFTPWIFDGHWNAQLQCAAQPGDLGWHTPCRLNGTGTFPACLDQFAHPVFGPAGGAPTSLIGVNLNAFLAGQFTGGVITSLPAAPNPGLTNTLTCFYLSNMTVNGRPEDPQQDVFWERIVASPNAVDDEGRHVFFVFVIHVSYRQTTWDFGDGTTVTIRKGGSSPETPPLQCSPIANQQFEVAHTYHSYSPPGGFHVTVAHQFGVDVSEFWVDSSGANRVDYPDVVPPVTVPALPLPFYAMPIVQEEGVPVG